MIAGGCGGAREHQDDGEPNGEGSGAAGRVPPESISGDPREQPRRMTIQPTKVPESESETKPCQDGQRKRRAAKGQDKTIKGGNRNEDEHQDHERLPLDALTTFTAQPADKS